METPKIIKNNQSLKFLNTFKLGGEAEFFAEAKTKEDLIMLIDWAEENNIKVLVLGGGSNIVPPDGLINALVLHMRNDNRAIKGDARLVLGAGCSLAQAGSLAMTNGLSGLEWASGIPRATIGGAVRGNAGAFGANISDIVETVEVYDTKQKRFEILSKNMCKFSYRDSIIKSKSNLLIWEIILKMAKNKECNIKEKMEKSIEFRFGKYPSLPSAGSIFENIDPEELRLVNPVFFQKEIEPKIGREGKVSTGLLIELAGLKGKSIGGIKISLEHANHIVNTGNGTSEQLIMMISYIKQQIRNKFKIQLKEEIVYFGF